MYFMLQEDREVLTITLLASIVSLFAGFCFVF
ncbi:hypothetical protein PCC7424_4035 [Gloeothece citriformis PCC 7424]|uniref:Uncharacterized protein n=1 Tax=Gloeothece citriformis (strain PCC 7424) TaxID=65393 RepID=B7KL37_GLOC7|nr:hypothetical protein PCC7424_4035 [Gloeothece citriformis PCC 7424]